METKVTEHYFKYGGNQYFRENAHNVDLASYGEKKDPVGRAPDTWTFRTK